MKLSAAKVGKSYKIVGFSDGTSKVSRRFMELGFTAGQRVKIAASSLQKKVFLIELRGYTLSVRAGLLEKIEVQE